MLATAQRYFRRRFAHRGWLPATRMGRLALYFAALDAGCVVLWAIFSRFRFTPDAAFSGWTRLLTFIVVLLVSSVAVRWTRTKLLWRLRNRLLVTYFFIGVTPVVLLGTLAYEGTKFLTGQFATFVATSNLKAELQRLDTLNSRVTSDIAERLRAGDRTTRKPVEADLMAGLVSGEASISAWYAGKPLLPGTSAAVPERIAGSDFHELSTFVFDGGHLFLRAARGEGVNGQRLVVLSSMALNKSLIDKLASQIGQIKVAPFESNKTPRKSGLQVSKDSTKPVTVQIGDQRLSTADLDQQPTTIVAGALPPARGFFDIEIDSLGILNGIDWQSGHSRAVALLVQTRPSLLYAQLSSTVGESAQILIFALMGLAIAFAIMELFALVIGGRMTRTITASVASLYTATQHVNRGELTHRIAVKRNDQLAALEGAFNSMMSSLQKLLEEQKEKQKLEHELAIGAEVQAQLFPRNVADLPNLEVFGVCHPARTVSGDYYDFLFFGSDRVCLALGDVSGKGISAALLMATIHSAVRAYTLESVPARSAAGMGHNAGAAVAVADGDISPSGLMSLLNRQLFRSTPAEKYATMFVGSFDGRTRVMNYCNAGHLAPLLLGMDGAVRRLDAGGTVVGLFDAVPYSEEEVRLSPGELFIAYSDGITEPENEFGEFGEERLVQLVAENRALPLPRIAEAVTAAVYDWIGGEEQPDDITLVLARAR
ncbi:MAG TPA: PP2C family protein-serine/threonine phosphatase [Terriglobales bacterium]|nr:PP2C family protein-serine/threonine phosphatase [Terriglobales bacterium]